MSNLSRETVERDIQRLSKESSGSSFWRVDLHTHSPASEDSRWSTSTTPHDFVAAFAKKGISLVAITDHSTGVWVDQLKDAAKKYSARSQTPFTILPGVELNANGIHISAILPENSTSSSISLLLGRLGLHQDDFGKEETCVFKSIADIASEVNKEGGLLVGAHCNSKNGVVDGLDGVPRQNALNAMSLLELRADQSRAKSIKTCSYVINDLRYPALPFVYSSDSHSESEIIPDVSLVKMHRPSFSGLRQLSFEPHLRTSGTSLAASASATLTGIVIDHGLYQDTAIPFNSDLNAIIGGRGAGKSALIDILSFCIGHDAIAATYQQAVNHRLVGFLSDGDEVRLYMSLQGAQYCVRRVMSSTRVRDEIRISSPPDLFRLRDTGPMKESQTIGDLLPVGIYGQGEVMEISKKGDDQLTLIDSFTDLTEIHKELKIQRERLDAANKARLEQAEKRGAVLEELASKPSITQRILEIDAHLQNPVFAQHQRWEDQKIYLDESDRLIQEISEIIPEGDPYADLELPELPDKTPAASPLKDAHSALKLLLRELRASTDKDQASLQAALRAVNQARDKWKKDYDAAKASLQATLRKLKLSDIEHVHSERNELQGQLNKIQRQHEPALKRIDEKLSSLSQERTSALDRIGTILGKRTQVRQTTADLLNSRLPENVNVRIMPLADDTAYFTFLSSTVLAGLGIRNRERHIQTLVSSFPPRTLANLIRSKNEDAVTAAGISPDATSKLLALPEEEVERIEECLLEDKPVISLRREGHADFSSLDQLSIGEKCSVILSLMLSSGDHPLIIDEPEAELDHEFICSSVVESIRSAKGKRQVLVCTHNPNIPVLGDAELVIKVTKVPGEPRCRVEHAAGFEDEQSIYFLKQLEGGEAALRKRSTKYQLASS